MTQYFLKQKSLGENMKVELDLSNNATKADLKNVTCIHKLDSVKSIYLAQLKSDEDKLDINKLIYLTSVLCYFKCFCNISIHFLTPVNSNFVDQAIFDFFLNKVPLVSILPLRVLLFRVIYFQICKIHYLSRDSGC